MSKFESYNTTVFGKDILTVNYSGGHQAEYIRLDGTIFCVEAVFSGYKKDEIVEVEVFGVATPEEDPEAFAFYERGELPVIPIGRGYW